MLKLIFLLISGFLFFQNAMASTLHQAFLENFPEDQKCATFKIAFSLKSIRKGENVRAYFIAEDLKNLRPVLFSWSISSGEIIKGDRTNSIIINTAQSETTRLTVTLEVKFYPTNCMNIASSEIYIILPQSQNKGKRPQKTPVQRSKRKRPQA